MFHILEKVKGKRLYSVVVESEAKDVATAKCR